MINKFTILNRKTSFIIKTFLFNTLILITFIIWGINTLYYQNYIQLHSKLLFYNSIYYLEVLIPVKEVNQITEHNQIIINNKTYYYKIYKTDNNATYKDNINYQKVYLEILNLDPDYMVNGYEQEVKILTEKKKIIKYLKE